MFTFGGLVIIHNCFHQVHQLKQVVDQWEVGDCGDAHVAAALLKTWYRELYEPLIPDALYQAAINAHDDPTQAVGLVNKLPEINRLVLSYLIRFVFIIVFIMPCWKGLICPL